MTFTTRLIIIAGGLVLCAVAIAVGVASMDDISPGMAEVLEIEQKWLVSAAVMYAVTFLVSWRFRGTFSVSATRMLAWAIVAYMTLSHGIDLLGEHRSEVPAVFGFASAGPDDVLLGLRVRLLGLFSILSMAITAIAVGFETPEQ